MKRRVFAIMIAAALIFTAVPVYPFAASGTGSDAGSVRSVYFGTWGAVDSLVYDDEFFTEDSSVYDPKLAAASAALGSSSCSSFRYEEGEEYLRASYNAFQFLEDNGFSDIYVNDDYKVKPDGTKAPALFAHKKIRDDGREYTLIALVPKGGAREAEYDNVAKAGKEGDFAHYVDIKDKTISYARDYIDEYDISGDIKLWIPGYSRGGGVADLVAAEIADDPQAALGSAVRLRTSDIFCYSISPYRVAELSEDLQADKYMGIHNIVSKDDFIISFPWELMSFGWHGQVHELTDGADKTEALRLLKASSESLYESYTNGGDPDEFSPMKLDLQALLSGQLSLAKDESSYLPDSLSEYIDSVMYPLVDLFAESGTDARDGYCKQYQDAVTDFMIYKEVYDFPEASAVLESKTAVPFILSAYISYISEKNAYADNEELTKAVESIFNALANIIEDENGNLRNEFSRIRGDKLAYRQLRNLFFSTNPNAGADLNGIPQKYKLIRKIKNDPNFVRAIKDLRTRLYARTMSDVLAAQNVDADLRKDMVSDRDSKAMSAIITQLIFGNDRQTVFDSPFDPDNQQFKQLATLVGNFSRYETLHYVENGMPWLQAASGAFDGYQGITDDMLAGYRRVYISGSNDAVISGTVRDDSGSVAAEFKNGKMVSRTDDMIGITNSDSGSWLRLPVSGNYKVEITTSKCTDISLKIADYSVSEGVVKRTVNGDENGDWSGIKTRAVDKLTLDIPAVSAPEDGSYDIISAVYTLSVSKGKIPVITTGKVPAVKRFKVKAARKSFKAGWTKLSSAKRAKVDKIEVQYSTKKSFKSSKTVSRKLSKSKKSLKVKKLKKGRTYYVRVRCIKYTDDATYVSKWSKAKKVKIR